MIVKLIPLVEKWCLALVVVLPLLPVIVSAMDEANIEEQVDKAIRNGYSTKIGTLLSNGVRIEARYIDCIMHPVFTSKSNQEMSKLIINKNRRNCT